MLDRAQTRCERFAGQPPLLDASPNQVGCIAAARAWSHASVAGRLHHERTVPRLLDAADTTTVRESMRREDEASV
jgi:hypothetical protein